MARTKSVAKRVSKRGSNGRGRPKKNKSASPVKDEEPRYVLAGGAGKARSSPAKSPEPRKSIGRLAASSGAKKNKKTALSPMSKFSREATARAGGSSQFSSPVKGRKGRHDKVESEEEVLEDEEEEEESEQEQSEEEEEESEQEQKQKKKPKVARKKTNTARSRTGRMGPEATINATFRLNLAAKVQRLRSDPRFTGIKAETLERVVEQFEKDNVTPSVIINTTVCKPVARRTRVAWTDEEIDDLHQGVARYGTSWSRILCDQQFNFNERTQVDLKDKWRNLNSKRLYSELPIRRFILVNEHHEPAMTDKGYYHVFNNRWPADAAVKVATKDFIYPVGVDSVRIYLREIPAEGKEGSPIVHVFDVSRKVELARNIPKFQGMGNVYVGEARKVCTERLLTRQAVFEDIRDSSRMQLQH